MPHVSVTRLRLRSLRFLPALVADLARTHRELRDAPGFRNGCVLADRNWAFWTITAWDDAGSMRGYMAGQAHRAAMPHLQEWCDEASVVHWEQAEDTLPSWDEADARMRELGRPSRVRHPSPRHAAMDYRRPRPRFSAPVQPRKQA